MGLKKALALCMFFMVLASLAAAGRGWTEERKQSFPSYGSGPVEVRLYTDYFCPPCRAMEPDVEKILQDLVKKNAIRLLLVDTPIHRYSPLYSRYFLYAIRQNNALEQILWIRNILIEASSNKEITTQVRIDALSRERGIAYSVWDPKPVFDRYNALITEDMIKATPSCVVIRNGQKKTFIGGAEILNALKDLT